MINLAVFCDVVFIEMIATLDDIIEGSQFVAKSKIMGYRDSTEKLFHVALLCI